MTSTPPSRDPGPTPEQPRRLQLVMAIALFAPIPLIWVTAATIVARGLRFPPALAYSTAGVPAPGKPAGSDTRPLRELLDAPSEEIRLGEVLRGYLVPSATAPAAVVLVYPNRVDAQAMIGYFRIIRSAGYAALIIDEADRA